jgi:hypothetical protein
MTTHWFPSGPEQGRNAKEPAHFSCSSSLFQKLRGEVFGGCSGVLILKIYSKASRFHCLFTGCAVCPLVVSSAQSFSSESAMQALTLTRAQPLAATRATGEYLDLSGAALA